MKQITLLLTIMLITLNGFSQTTYNIYKLMMGNWNEYSQVWDWDDTEFTGIMIFKGSKIYISDRAKTEITILRKIDEDDNAQDKRIYYSGYDEKHKTVRVIYTYYKTSNVMSVSIMYSDTDFKYFIKKQDDMDNFRD